jgi:hypothetical protein
MRLNVIPALLGLAAGAVVTAAFTVPLTLAEASPAAVAPSIPYRPCFGTTPNHVQLPGHIAYECLGSGEFGKYPSVGVYWSDNLYELNYYLHPGHGALVTDEVFFKSCAEVSLERHGAPCALYGGFPAVGLPPVDHYGMGRLIWMSDGCIVLAPTDRTTVPTSCAQTITGGGSIVSGAHAMTPAEQLSANVFWQVMDRYTPDNYW